jgi:C4-dicarboxylate transporter DctM subunit
MAIGLVTPPVGLNPWCAPLPWLDIRLIFLNLIALLPAISTFLPNLLYGL